MRFTKVSASAVEKFSHYGEIRKMIPSGLITRIQKLINRLWNAVGPAITQVSDWVRSAFDRLPDKDSLDWAGIAEAIDTWYQRCGTINFFIAIMLLLTGSSIVNDRGNIEKLAT